MSGIQLRADAARNRELLLDAAVEVFAERGVDVPLEEIAGRAGVGIATLYRRFATREDLLAGVASRKMEAYENALRDAAAQPDPWLAFAGFVETICATQATDAHLADILTITFPSAPEFEARQHGLFAGYLALVERAKSAGQLREDYSPEDLPMLLMANAGVLRDTAEAAPNTWKRLVAYLLQALRTPARLGPLPPPPSARQMQRAMLRAGACKGRPQREAD